jgi:putative PIN family toxin of toxin-antitoxin system
MANPQSPSGMLLAACETRLAVALLSKPLIKEYRSVIARVAESNAAIQREKIQILLKKLMYLGEYIRSVRARFPFARDPTDAKLIELAIEGRATHLASFDRDLLSLPMATTEAGKRLRQRVPNLRVMTPLEIIRQNPQLIG